MNERDKKENIQVSDAARSSEFALIDTYFKNKMLLRSDVDLGIGDDAALLAMPSQQLLAVAMDTLVEGIHFPVKTSAYDIGYKSLAVNLSDLAAMGAQPAWLSLALTMPEADLMWLQQFSEGLFYLANQYGMQLVGGDTTCGSLTITIQVYGFVPREQALRRDGATAGDKIYVSGTLGDAGLGLQVAKGKYQLVNHDHDFIAQRLNQPTPHVELGLLLRDVASSAIDISDGLLADLNHIMQLSHLGAEINANLLPLSSTMRKKLSSDAAKKLALTAGDDYELCFTVSPAKEKILLDKLKADNHHATCIGVMTREPGIRLLGYADDITSPGYLHFSQDKS